MGLFDRFKRRVQEVADDVDSEELTATEDSDEGQVALQTATEIEEDWEEEPLSEPAELPAEPTDSDDEWDDWDEEEEEIELPRQLSKKERKRMEKIGKATRQGTTSQKGDRRCQATRISCRFIDDEDNNRPATH
jgi:hypothetical protein